MWAAPFAGDRVDRFDVLGAHLVEPLVGEGDDVRLADAWLQCFEDVLVDAVDHRRCLRQQDDLVVALDLASSQHHLLSVAYLDAGAGQLEEHLRLGHVDTERHAGDALVLEDGPDLAHRSGDQARFRSDRAGQAGVSTHAVRRVEPWRLQLVNPRRRSEVPDPRLAGTGEQGPPLHLVERPVADVRGGEVANVGGVEDEQRAEIGRFERSSCPLQSVSPEPLEVDALLPVDPHDSWSRCGRDRELCSALDRTHRVTPPARRRTV